MRGWPKCCRGWSTRDTSHPNRERLKHMTPRQDKALQGSDHPSTPVTPTPCGASASQHSRRISPPPQRLLSACRQTPHATARLQRRPRRLPPPACSGKRFLLEACTGMGCAQGVPKREKSAIIRSAQPHLALVVQHAPHGVRNVVLPHRYPLSDMIPAHLYR